MQWKQCGLPAKYIKYVFLRKHNYLFLQVKFNNCSYQEKLNWCGFIVNFQYFDNLVIFILFFYLIKTNKLSIKIKINKCAIYLFIYIKLYYIVIITSQISCKECSSMFSSSSLTPLISIFPVISSILSGVLYNDNFYLRDR